jgi:predicted transcriptional regulator of viral defense system
VHEQEETVELGSEAAGYGATVSTLERALLDAARRPDLVGGYLPLAEALAGSRPELDRLLELAKLLNANTALRRIGSLADWLELQPLAAAAWPKRPTFDIDLDPGLKHLEPAFRDPKWRIRWPIEPSALKEEIAR